MKRMVLALLALLLCSSLFLPFRAIPQASYQVVTVADGGTIAGTVKWSGPPVRPPSVPIT